MKDVNVLNCKERHNALKRLFIHRCKKSATKTDANELYTNIIVIELSPCFDTKTDLMMSRLHNELDDDDGSVPCQCSCIPSFRLWVVSLSIVPHRIRILVSRIQMVQVSFADKLKYQPFTALIIAYLRMYRDPSVHSPRYLSAENCPI
jgi:hypothetical protein